MFVQVEVEGWIVLVTKRLGDNRRRLR